MKTNPILDEIHRVREDIARECNYDVDVLFARMREHLERLKAEGWQVVYPEPRQPDATVALREETPRKDGSPGEKRP